MNWNPWARLRQTRELLGMVQRDRADVLKLLAAMEAQRDELRAAYEREVAESTEAHRLLFRLGIRRADANGKLRGLCERINELAAQRDNAAEAMLDAIDSEEQHAEAAEGAERIARSEGGRRRALEHELAEIRARGTV